RIEIRRVAEPRRRLARWPERRQRRAWIPGVGIQLAGRAAGPGDLARHARIRAEDLAAIHPDDAELRRRRVRATTLRPRDVVADRLAATTATTAPAMATMTRIAAGRGHGVAPGDSGDRRPGERELCAKRESCDEEAT